jgi:hypothetical protein
MIAKNAVEEGLGDDENVASKVLSVLNEYGSDLLSIEDVLPFLPDVGSKVLSVLNECRSDLLSIEDVLPFLPDVAQID